MTATTAAALLDRLATADTPHAAVGALVDAVVLSEWVRRHTGRVVPPAAIVERPQGPEIVTAVRAADAQPVEDVHPQVLDPRTVLHAPSFQQRARLTSRYLSSGNTEPTPVAYYLDGQFDAAAWRCALDAVLQRHDALRTRFVVGEDGQATAAVDPADAASWPVHEVDLRPLPSSRRTEVAEDLVRTLARIPFTLNHGPIVAAVVVRLGESQWLVALYVDHMVFDGVSITVLADEVSSAYAAALSGRPWDAPPLSIQYYDYARQQERQWAGPDGQAALAYWDAMFREWSAYPPRVPFLRGEAALPPAAGLAPAQSIEFLLDERTVQAVQAAGRARHASTFMVGLTAFLAALATATGTERVGVATADAGRRLPGGEGLIGTFSYSIPLWCSAPRHASFDDVLAGVRTATLEALLHSLPAHFVLQQVPLADYRQADGFTVYFRSEAGEPALPRLPGATAQRHVVAAVRPFVFGTELSVVMTAHRGQWRVLAEFSDDVHRRDAVAALIEQFVANLRVGER